MKYILVTHEFQQEGSKIVARCRELGTSTFGKTLQEANQLLTEAVELHLNALEEAGELERFLQENSVQVHHSSRY